MHFILQFLLNQHENELIESLRNLKLLSETKPMDEVTALAMWINTNIGKYLIKHFYLFYFLIL